MEFPITSLVSPSIRSNRLITHPTSRLLVTYLDRDKGIRRFKSKPPRFTTCPLLGLGLSRLRACSAQALLLSMSASIFRAREAGTRAFNMRLSRPGTILERFFDQTAEALRYALLDAHRFHRHSLRIEGELFEHRCVRNPGCKYSDVDTQRFELIVKCLAKAVCIRLRASVIRHTGNAVFRTPLPPRGISRPASARRASRRSNGRCLNATWC